MYRFRIYLTKDKKKDELCLDAFVKEDYKYEILYSGSQLYENLLKEGLNSDLSIIYIDEQTKETKIQYIDQFNNVKQSMQNTAIFLGKWYNLGVSIDEIAN